MFKLRVSDTTDGIRQHIPEMERPVRARSYVSSPREIYPSRGSACGSGHMSADDRPFRLFCDMAPFRGIYYWRIDAVNRDGKVTTGALWSFRTGDR